MVGTARVAIVDEHDVVRAGLQSWLAGQDPAVSVVGSFSDPTDYLNWLASQQEAHVLVAEIQVDSHAPDIDLLRVLCAAGPVVVHSRMATDEVILSSMDAGAHCFIAKADGRQHLLAAITHAANDRTYTGPHMAGAAHRCDVTGRLGPSDRERQVLVAWLQTESKDDVARRLHIAPATVRTHRRGLRLVKYKQASTAYQRYGPYALVDQSTNRVAVAGLDAAALERELFPEGARSHN